MKSPKEEAEELVNKFWELVTFSVAVHFAIICVDRIINEIDDGMGTSYFDNFYDSSKKVMFWKQVKSELEQMK